MIKKEGGQMKDPGGQSSGGETWTGEAVLTSGPTPPFSLLSLTFSVMGFVLVCVLKGIEQKIIGQSLELDYLG